MADLFDRGADQDAALAAPLPERVRPTSLDDIVGQDELLGPGRMLREALARGQVPSCILWGPPGSGKTTLARTMARHVRGEFVPFSAVLGGVKEIREIVAAAEERWKMRRARTVLFVDEIHRFNKAQQDAFLPHLERGLLSLVGATPENPSFELTAALLSRCRVLVLSPLSEEDLTRLLARALQRDAQFAALGVRLPEAALARLAAGAFGDARRALAALEAAAEAAGSGGEITEARVAEALARPALRHDKTGDSHYDLASAMIKSLRGSDPDAALYYAARLVEGGEPPRFVLRRLVIFAAEDIGNADPRALSVAVDAFRACELVGLPEAVLPLSQAVCYLACAPKSATALVAWQAALADVRERGPLPVPPRIRNAPTRLMKDLGYGREYRYPHDFPGHHVAEVYLPDALAGRRYYEPAEQGMEREIGERLARWRKAVEEARR